MKSLEGRVAVVTGAASGVGLGIAEVLAPEQARVVVVDVDMASAERAAAEALKSAGGCALAVAADVVDRAAMDAMAAKVLDRLGRIDIVAANAGIYPSVAIDEMADADWDRVMDINVKGVLHTGPGLPALDAAARVRADGRSRRRSPGRWSARRSSPTTPRPRRRCSASCGALRSRWSATASP